MMAIVIPPPSSATTRAAGEPEEESITSRFVAERITHVLILLGHCGHAAFFRLIVRCYPESLDTKDDDRNLPIHLLSSQTVFNVTRKVARVRVILFPPDIFQHSLSLAVPSAPKHKAILPLSKGAKL